MEDFFLALLKVLAAVFVVGIGIMGVVIKNHLKQLPTREELKNSQADISLKFQREISDYFEKIKVELLHRIKMLEDRVEKIELKNELKKGK